MSEPEQKMVSGGFTEQQMVSGDFTEQRMVSGDFTEQRMVSGDFTEQQMVSGDFTEQQMVSGDFTEQQMVSGDFTLRTKRFKSEPERQMVSVTSCIRPRHENAFLNCCRGLRMAGDESYRSSELRRRR